MKAKNLTELFSEFKKYCKTKKDITKDEENFYDYVMLSTSQDLINEHPGYSDLNSISLSLGKQEFPKSITFVNIDISSLKNNKTDEKFSIRDAWIEREENVLKILKDIWTTGEVKDTYGLDLDWPSNEKSKITKSPSESTGSEFKENKNIKEQSSQGNNKIYWIIGSLVLVSLMGLIVWFTFKRIKNKS